VGAAVAAAPRQGAEVVTVYTALNAVREIVTPIVEANKDRMTSHWESCYKHDAPCLAALIAERIEEELNA
jgi:hypothetical protein